ncbi:hypothetical protein J7T55_006659 [Diaporthe amygdali]|uniref:uncharacterized protein n=1 Tax=Phomopsis amygdali TaxID=1214568 RepID=UPI0022FDBFA9|nr:uncharacterized protein J7T55_006659 [Diaporthe amygdali]KAJ0125314.1 hypothetical protein J7T55_006659 [Diaporthe amygdali]
MNSTTIPPSAISGPVGLQMQRLAHTLQSGLSRYRPELETLFVLAMYSPFLVQTFSYSSPKLTRARGFPYLPMIAHIFSGPLYVLRYHARYAALRVWPKPDPTDLVLFSLFNLSSFLLEVRRSRSSYSTAIIRSGFQAAILMHAVVFAASWLRGQDPVLFRASVKFLNWFAWFRITERTLPVIDPRLRKMANFGTKFELTSALSASLAVWEAGVPAGVPVILGMIATTVMCERVLAKILIHYSDDNPLKRLVFASGYVDFNYIKEHESQSTDPEVEQGDGTKVEL